MFLIILVFVVSFVPLFGGNCVYRNHIPVDDGGFIDTNNLPLEFSEDLYVQERYKLWLEQIAAKVKIVHSPTLGKVKKLDLTGELIVDKEIPRVFQYIPGIQVLSLRSCRYLSKPKIASVNLLVLNLAGTKISDSHAIVIAMNCPNLVTLQLPGKTTRTYNRREIKATVDVFCQTGKVHWPSKWKRVTFEGQFDLCTVAEVEDEGDTGENQGK